MTSSLQFQHFIDGQFIASADNLIDVINPATEQSLGAAPDAGAALTDSAIGAARAAQDAWAAQPAIARAQYLRRIAAGIREAAPQIANVIAREQGKLLALAQLEVGLAAEYLDYYAEWARRIEGEIISSDRPGENMFLFRRPMGVVAGILPWNFPFFMIARKVAPALITGNTIVIKPSEETPFCAYEFARIVESAGLPPGVFNLVNGLGSTVGQQLVTSAAVDMISFTGSSGAGSTIMANAARNVTKLSLELGGKAPSIVLADANLDLAVAALRWAKTMNTGQACNCSERVYVQRSVYERFCEQLRADFATIRMGDPLAESSDMGSLINRAAVERLTRQVDDARGKGAEVLIGGKGHEAGAGCFFEPTILINTGPGMDVLEREIFGPMLLIEPVDDLDQAIALSNDSEYGLTSSIFTNDLNSAMRAVSRLKFGETYVNRENFEAIQGFHAGVRRSGIGGADGKHGLYEYTHTQVAYIQS
ncbi:aldehyde dehydrogenase [Pseudomonas sp. MYb185]|uniref:aldehyde dehydrogenase n=1 Tax=Pseudomonas sp. MYb185 TaxID=1848729 RepID=UPI000CFCF9B0|nr:aldehyde dehydrogenase [Pseudomonas sp. MYb185]PRB77442.1 aldehyde dehydrogenase [Pseudomonas sp. MYb185]